MAAAQARILGLAAAPAGLDRRMQDLPADAVHQALTDLVTLAGGAGSAWQDTETAAAMAEVLAATGLLIGTNDEPQALAMADLLEADARVLRGVAADVRHDRAEAHRQFTLAERARSPLDPFASLLGTIGRLGTGDDEPLGDRRVRKDVGRALEAVPGNDRSAADAVLGALITRGSARDTASLVASGTNSGSASRKVGRWLRAHGAQSAPELWFALLPGLSALSWEPGPAALERARLLDAAFENVPGLSSFRDVLESQFRGRGELHRSIEVLEELYALGPGPERPVLRLAATYSQVGEDGKAESILRAHLTDPPAPEDGELVRLLVLTLLRTGSPEAVHWDAHLSRLRDGSGLAATLPTDSRKGFSLPPARLLARLENGTLTIDPSAAALPPPLLHIHMTAALIVGSPDGPDRLRQLADEDPETAAQVAELLGVPLEAPVALSERTEVAELLLSGDLHFQQREFEQAAGCYRQALELDPDSTYALLWLGDVYFAQQQRAFARAYFEESLAAGETPMAWRFLGDVLGDRAETVERARACYERALALDPGYGGAREALAALPRSAPPGPAVDESRMGAPPKSQTLWSRAWLARAATPQAPRHTPGAAQEDPAFQTLSEAGALTGLPAKFEALVRSREPCLPGVLDTLTDDDAFGRWKEQWLPHHFATVTSTLTALVWQWNAKSRETGRALLLARRQVQIAETLTSQWGDGAPHYGGRALIIADALQQLASVLKDLGRWAEAYAVLRRAEESLETDQRERERAGRPLTSLHDEPDDVNPRIALHQELAETAALCGDQEAAERHREASRGWNERAPVSDHQRVVALVEEGLDRLEAGDADGGLDCLDRALPMAERAVAWLPVKQTLAVVHHFRARALTGLGLHRTALRHIAEARACNTGNADRLATDWLATAEILRARPDLGDALQAFEHALSLSGVPGQEGDPLLWRPRHGTGGPVRIQHPERAWEVVVPMARAARESGACETAISVLELGVEVADLVRAAQNAPAQRRHVQDQRADVYELLIQNNLEQGRTEAAFTAAERLRARTLLDAMSTAELRPPDAVPADRLAREAALLSERTALERAPLTDWGRHHQVREELERLWSAISAHGPAAEDYVEVRRATVSGAAALAGELAGERVVVVSYARLGDGRTVLFVLDPRAGLSVVPVDADSGRIDRFVADNLGSAGRVREAAIDMPDLLRQVLSPLVAPLTGLTDPGDTVVICPTGVLQHVPFHALSPDGGAVLLDRNPVAYLPSASLLTTLRRRTPHTGRGAVVLGDPGGDLPYARAEAEYVARRLNGVPLVGRAATRERVLRDMDGAEIFHAACHASFDPDDPMSSGLSLADGLLTGHDILRQDWQGVRLAVLSACETGLGSTGRTDEAPGLSRALLFSGVRSLVISLWRVPDDTTATLMGDFHDLTLAGEAPAAALRTAMLAARDRPGGDRLDRWAGFCLLGEWRAPDTLDKGAKHAEHH
ncbi:CHAT domain-containing protein [Streptomyces sp. NBC_00247]|uniref:CHAT domain-containing protein n=1 Tax=Streptomyces sp. NBC_00247 TaxID=2975689 RepID=UPI002E294A44|nr:CHAT domain-containing protein [Streptomyces sp. NBC_00247]